MKGVLCFVLLAYCSIVTMKQNGPKQNNETNAENDDLELEDHAYALKSDYFDDYSGQGDYENFAEIHDNKKCMKIIKKEGPISSSVNKNKYSKNINCLWRFRAPVGHVVRLEFSQFAVERHKNCKFDYVRIYDGPRQEKRTLIANLCGVQRNRDSSYPTEPYISSGQYLTLRFKTNHKVQRRGWTASVTFIRSFITCSSSTPVVIAADVRLTYPPSGTTGNLTCAWLARAPENHYVQFHLLELDIPIGTFHCVNYLELHDGDNWGSPAIGQTMCGTTDHNKELIRTSSGRAMLVVFRDTDGSSVKGFVGQLSVVETPGLQLCPRQIITPLIGEEGILQFPPFGDFYVNDVHCLWSCIAEPGKKIKLTFLHFDVEYDPKCRLDVLKIYDGVLRPTELCGIISPGHMILSSSSSLRMEFVSDSSNTATGFKIEYAIVDLVRDCGRSLVSPDHVGNIIGGEKAKPNAWPWQVSLRIEPHMDHLCGASVISSDWVVTAAHCIIKKSTKVYAVQAGAHPNEYFTQVRDVSQIVLYPGYTVPGSGPDVALLRLVRPLYLSTLPLIDGAVFPVCLPPGDVPVPDDMPCNVTGWGDTGNPETEGYLNQVTVPIIPQNVCQRENYYGALIKEYEVCAGYEGGGRDSCQGDSGGPLVCLINDHYELHGITSWGIGCARAKKPGVYTRVTEIVQWIKDTIGFS